ncbi:calpain-9 [Patella vulgata]|uniref:calpain-9 n=1 Tax=Patella vulgata TaxID=6465 RepID=UPI0024A878A2|nr:calpain-9 [Patella vulgata]
MATNGFVRPSSKFNDIRYQCLKSGKKFVDSDFPPNDRSIYINGQGRGQYGQIFWKRPGEIVRRPRYVVGDVARHDMDQGGLGDCWFIAAAAILCTSHRNMFERVVPLDQDFDRNYAGIFRFNFWWYGEWVEVIIDDYLPTDGRRLKFGKNREHVDEFWCALLEKAYAKLRGSYEGIDGGKIQDALVDFTGGIGEVIDLKHKNKIPRNLFHLLHKSIAMNSMVGASIARPPGATESEIELTNGLYMGHAYSITGIREVPFGRKSAHLLRLRNPWGRGEWKGPWSDSSPEIRSLPPAVKRDLEIGVQEDGEFWITYGDVIEQFDEIEMCHLQPDALTEEIAADENTTPWNVTVYHDAWKRGITAGGCGNKPYQDLYWINPQFFIKLSLQDEDSRDGECTLIVSLTEKEKNNQSKIAIGFDIYKLRSPELRPLNGERASRNAMLLAERSGQYQFYREVTRRFEFSPGVYAIVPSTFKPNVEAKFLLRLYTEKAAESGILDDVNPDPVVSPTTPSIPPVITPTYNIITELFLQYSGRDKRLDYKELGYFIKTISYREFGEQLTFSEEACRSLITCMDRNRSGFIDAEETQKMWKEITAYREVFKQFDRDRSGTVDGSELEFMFSKLGFPIHKSIMQGILRRYGGRQSTLSLNDFVIVICKLVLMFGIFQEQRDKTRSDGRDDVAQFTLNEFLQYSMFC